MTQTLPRATNFRWFLTGSLLMASALFVHAVAAATRPQKTAPTVEQCRADLHAWGGQVEQPNGLSASEMENRASEMLKCFSIDSPENPEANDAYSSMAKHYGFWLEVRMSDFLVRHNLWKQFHDEDAQGLR